MRCIIIMVLLIFATHCINAQVGINTNQPHPSAALEINGDNKKGLLIPFMDQEERAIAKEHSPKGGLLIYDPIEKIFYFYNGAGWIAVNPLQATDGTTDTVRLANGGTTLNVGQNLTVTGVVDIKGSTTLDNPLVVNSTLTTTGTINAGGDINAGSHVINAGTVNVGTGTVITSDKVKTTTVEGFGVTPIGGIIMWSGNIADIPSNWALCNGETKENRQTPNLSGRFIVGYDSGDSDYNSIGKQGGEKKHTLTIPEMPSHNHSIANITNTSGGGTKTSDRDWHENMTGTEINSGNRGDSLPHENRPPYYVLAFIMRVK